ncbi:MAG: hypothetical protein WDO18_15145 [Acidobacteriota bacterium]
MSASSLLEAIQRNLGRPAKEVEKTETPRGLPSRGLPSRDPETILLADDDSNNRTLALSILKRQGFIGC